MHWLAAIGGATDSLLISVIAFLAVLTVVVFVHEFGHFWIGRLCGVGVTAFSLGFGPELVGWTDRRGTRWKISAIPLGGYVKFVGDLNAASMPDSGDLARMSPEERAVSFPVQSVAKRAAIVAAGPIANFILAIAIFTSLNYIEGREELDPRIAVVQPNSAAERAGFQPDDLILSIDGSRIDTFSDMQRLVGTNPGQTLSIRVERGDKEVVLEATPDLKEQDTPFGKQRIGLLGIEATHDKNAIHHLSYTPWGGFKAALVQTWNFVDTTVGSVRKMILGRISTDQLSGPIRIAEAAGKVASLGGVSGLIGLAAVLSVSIGLINLLPIPLLDGGHLLFYAIEAVRGRPLSEKAQEIGFGIGFAIVAALMLLATWNDLVHLTTGFMSSGT